MQTNLLIVLIVLILAGCQDRKAKTATSVDFEKTYRDSVFLEIPGGDLFERMTGGTVGIDMNIYERGFNRIMRHVYLEDGKLAWDLKKGADVKISENIFDWITHWLKYNNEENLPSGDYEIRQEIATGFYCIVGKELPESGYRMIETE